jgi:hypothetical protein
MERIEPGPRLDHRASDLNEAIGVLADRIDIVGRQVDGRARCVNRACSSALDMPGAIKALHHSAASDSLP